MSKHNMFCECEDCVKLKAVAQNVRPSTPSKGQPNPQEPRYQNLEDLRRYRGVAQPGVGEILNHLYQFNDYGSFQFAKAQLLAHALSLKPERMDENLKEIKDPIESARAVGFNQGLDLWEQSLREGYGE